MPDYIR